MIYTLILADDHHYYIAERHAKNKIWTIHKFIITSHRYNRYHIINRYLISREVNVNYPSLLNLVQSVLVINAKYVA